MSFKKMKTWVGRNLENPISVFLVLSVSFGVLFVFLTPPFQSPDEQAHFYRAYQVSELHAHGGSLTIDGVKRYGAELPISIVHDTELLKGNVSGHPDIKFPKLLYKTTINNDLNSANKQFVTFEGTEIYSPAPYIPQAAGIFLGRIFQASPLILMWLGRLCNLAVWIGCIYIALRMIPLAKWGVVILALNPLSLFQAASLSADALTIGSVFVFVCLVLRFMKHNRKLTSRELAALGLIVCLLPLMKPTYLLLSALTLIIPVRVFGSFKRYLLFCVGTLILAASFTLGWNVTVAEIINASANIFQPGLGVSSQAQIHFILTHPITYLHILSSNYVIGTYSNTGDAVLRSYNGTFGWLDSSTPLWTVIVQANVLLLALLYQIGRGVVATVKSKLWISTLLVLTAGATITALYVGYTPVGSPSISGVQGRYFIPIVVLLIPLFTGRKKIVQLGDPVMGIIMSSGLFVVLLATTATLIDRYYR